MRCCSSRLGLFTKCSCANVFPFFCLLLKVKGVELQHFCIRMASRILKRLRLKKKRPTNTIFSHIIFRIWSWISIHPYDIRFIFSIYEMVGGGASYIGMEHTVFFAFASNGTQHICVNDKSHVTCRILLCGGNHFHFVWKSWVYVFSRTLYAMNVWVVVRSGIKVRHLQYALSFCYYVNHRIKSTLCVEMGPHCQHAFKLILWRARIRLIRT